MVWLAQCYSSWYTGQGVGVQPMAGVLLQSLVIIGSSHHGAGMPGVWRRQVGISAWTAPQHGCHCVQGGEDLYGEPYDTLHPLRVIMIVLCTRAFAFPCFTMGSSSSICPSGSWETYNIHWVLYVYSCHHDNLYSNVVTITIMGKKILKTDVTIHTCGVMVYETVLEGWLCTALIRCGFWLI